MTLFVFSLFFVSGCERRNLKLTELAGSDSVLIYKYLSDSLVANVWINEGNTTLVNSRNGERNWVLSTQSLVNNQEKGVITVIPLDMVQYDSLGSQIFRIVSEKGYYNPEENMTIATGEVVLSTFMRDNKGILHTDSLVHISQGNLIESFPVYMEIFNTAGDTLVYKIEADYGWIKADSAKFFLKGNVSLVHKIEDVVLIGEDVVYDNINNVVRSEGNVKFKRGKGDFIKGKGFVSDREFENWKILSSIQGELVDIEINEDGF